MKIAILIPFYNEAENLPKLFRALSKAKEQYPILCVDDGSMDDSLSFCYMYGYDYLTYYPNRGKGAAIKEGSISLINDGYDYILVMDSDLQCSITDIPNFIQAQKRYPNAKIIVGNRLNKPVGMPKIRLFINKLMSWVISFLAGQKIPDSQCGFRLIHKDVFDLNLKANRFDFESEMLIKAGRKGYEIKSVPIKCKYYQDRESKIHPIRDTWRFVKLCIQSLI